MIKDAQTQPARPGNPPGPDRLLGWMASLADPTRLRLLHALDQQELGVAELCEVLQIPQSTVSRHLKILTDQGWTRHRRKGTAHLYQSRVDELDPAAGELLELTRRQVEHWPALNQDRLRLVRCLRKREQDPQSFFARAAADWDQLRLELYGVNYITTALLGLLPSDWTVADLGCGTGAMLPELSPYVKRVIGVDQSREMLDAAKHRSKHLPNVELRRGSVEELPIDTASCDAAMFVLVLSYLEEPPTALREAARILKPGGRIVIVDLLHHDRDDFRRQVGQRWPGFREEELGRWLLAAGFASPRVRPLDPDPRAKAPAPLLASAQRASETQDSPSTDSPTRRPTP